MCVDALGARATLYDSPEEDGRPHGSPLASSTDIQAVADGAELIMGSYLVFVGDILSDTACGAAVVLPAAPPAAKSTAALRTAPFRAPARRVAAAPPPPPPQPPDARVTSERLPAAWSLPAAPKAFAMPGPAAEFVSAQLCSTAPLLTNAALLSQLDDWQSASANEGAAGGVASAAPPTTAGTRCPDAGFPSQLQPAPVATGGLRKPPVPSKPPAPTGAFRAPAAALSNPASVRTADRGDGGVRQLRFPSPRDAPASRPGGMPPATFSTPQQYADAMQDALYEHVQAMVNHTARTLHLALGSDGASAQRRLEGPAVRAVARRANLGYYASAEFTSWRRSVEHGGRGKRARLSRARGADDEDDADHDAADAPETSYALLLKDTAERENAREYARGDLWVLSSSPVFDASAGGWTSFGVSTFHGPSPEGRLGMVLLGACPPGLGAHGVHAKRVFAMRCFNMACEHDQLQTLGEVALRGGAMTSLLPLLLRPLSGPPPAAVSPDKTLMQRYNLNDSQVCVLQMAAAVVSRPLQTPSITLVQGPFGCGKTHTLAALVRHLCEVLGARGGNEHRILVAGFTNACVDNLLCALLDAGFDDFVRCGSLRRIALRILPFAVGSKASGGATKADDEQRELEAMLAAAKTPKTRAALLAELQARKAGASAARARKVATCRVVAVTTASCVQDRLKGQSFSFLLIDEAAQLTEPAALVPLARFGARVCCLVGDPAQLPPLLVNGDERSALGRSLFSRLVAAGQPSLLLNTQYRCHPRLTIVPNAMWYGNRLCDGVTEEQRPPLLPGLAPLVFIDLPPHLNGQSVLPSVACRVVRELVSGGVPADDVGIICFLRAVVSIIKGRLSAGLDADVEQMCSTVDAFQGQERDVVIVVFASLSPNFATAERLNVALTRARHHIICIGCSRSPLGAEPWFGMLLRTVRAKPRSYWQMLDEHAPLPRWHESPALPPVVMPPPAFEPPATVSSASPPPAVEAPEPPLAAALDDGALDSLLCSDFDDDLVAAPLPHAAPCADDDATYLCSAEAEEAFVRAAFTSADLWAAYKTYHLYSAAAAGRASATKRRAAFLATKLGARRLCASVPDCVLTCQLAVQAPSCDSCCQPR